MTWLPQSHRQTFEEVFPDAVIADLRQRVNAVVYCADLYPTDDGYQLEAYGRGAVIARRLTDAGFVVLGYKDDRMYGARYALVEFREG